MIKFRAIPGNTSARYIAIEMNDKGIKMECQAHRLDLSTISIKMVDDCPEYRVLGCCCDEHIETLNLFIDTLYKDNPLLTSDC